MFELDRSMKILAARYPHIFQRLLFGDNPDIKFEKVEDSAINIAEHRADKLFRFRERSVEKLISLEFVTQPKQRDMRGFHAKNGLLTASYNLDVITVIVYVEKGRYRTFPREYVVKIGGMELRTQFGRILLWEHVDRIRSGEFRELAPLLVLLEDNPTTATILREKELLHGVGDQREQADLLGLATMLAFRRFREEIIRELFYEEYDMLKESSFIKEWIEEGRAEGRVEGQILLILKLLKKILGRVSVELEQKIRSLSESEIERLSYDLLDMKKTADLEQWLRRHEENSKN